MKIVRTGLAIVGGITVTRVLLRSVAQAYILKNEVDRLRDEYEVISLAYNEMVREKKIQESRDERRAK